MCVKLLDFSSLSGLSINNYSLVYNSNLSSMFKDIEDSNLISMIESSLIKNIILCFIKDMKMPFNNIFELSVDMINETYKTTLDISVIMKQEIINYMDLFYKLYKELECDISSSHYPIDEINYKLVMMERNNDNFYREGKHSYLLW